MLFFWTSPRFFSKLCRLNVSKHIVQDPQQKLCLQNLTIRMLINKCVSNVYVHEQPLILTDVNFFEMLSVTNQISEK